MTPPFTPPSHPGTVMELVLITGMSGSGKSVALHALEDAGYYCVDNLPPELLESFVAIEREQGVGMLAVAMDVRSAKSLPSLSNRLFNLRRCGVSLRLLFLDATTDTLVLRFSETRRLHPLSLTMAADHRRSLMDAIEYERELLAALREQSLVLDTSHFKSAHLRTEIKRLVQQRVSGLTLVFASFAFKRGIPMDADYVFDVRMLPNPHYESDLRHQTGLDPGVVRFLDAETEVDDMHQHLVTFLERWLPRMAADHRSYVTVAVGCTGGQHRSVYLVERLARHFSLQYPVQCRHREIDARRH